MAEPILDPQIKKKKNRKVAEGEEENYQEIQESPMLSPPSFAFCDFAVRNFFVIGNHD
ncbi:hypothetical protein LQZ19_14500 [Treponema primitia]|uniref:hypothetical protein n=1 Tax=Treponema primitia TaxID=88058 RepID=UPI00397F2460